MKDILSKHKQVLELRTIFYKFSYNSYLTKKISKSYMIILILIFNLQIFSLIM